MHILRLTPHFYWPQLEGTGWPVSFDTIGGMQTQVFRQTVGLSEFKVRQTVLALKIPGAPERWEMNEHVTVRGVRVPILPLRSRIRGMVDLNPSWALGIVHEVLGRRPQCDIVHVHCSGVIWPLLVGLAVAPLLRARLVLTVHCSILATYEAMSSIDHALQPLARRIERAALRRATHTIVLSPRVRKLFLEEVGVRPESLSIVPDSLDVRRFQDWATPERVAEFKRRFPLPDGRPVITYIGRIAREKGWRHLVELAERLRSRGAHFLICGDGNERDLLEEELRQRGLSESFTITGYLPQEMIPAALAHTSVVVLASLHEEFGGALIEAMAMKVPSVAFAVGGVPNTLNGGESGLLVKAGDVAGMADAVGRLLDAPALAAHIGQAGFDYVRHKFELDSACHDVYKIYREVM